MTLAWRCLRWRLVVLWWSWSHSPPVSSLCPLAPRRFSNWRVESRKVKKTSRPAQALRALPKALPYFTTSALL